MEGAGPPIPSPSRRQLIGEPVTRLIQDALTARTTAERAYVLGQQADRLLSESERLLEEAQQLVRDAARED